MNSHWGVLLDWTVVDFLVLGVAIQQYVSISRDLKRSKAKEAESKSFCEQNLSRTPIREEAKKL